MPFSSEICKRGYEIGLAWFLKKSLFDPALLFINITRSNEVHSIGLACLNTWLPYWWETNEVFDSHEVRTTPSLNVHLMAMLPLVIVIELYQFVWFFSFLTGFYRYRMQRKWILGCDGTPGLASSENGSNWRGDVPCPYLDNDEAKAWEFSDASVSFHVDVWNSLRQDFSRIHWLCRCTIVSDSKMKMESSAGCWRSWMLSLNAILHLHQKRGTGVQARAKESAATSLARWTIGKIEIDREGDELRDKLEWLNRTCRQFAHKYPVKSPFRMSFVMPKICQLRSRRVGS